jgi:hypothetical protein
LAPVMALTLAFATAACSSDILNVNDPDLVVPDNLKGAQGAELFRAGAIGDFASAFASFGGQASYVGMFTDEFHLSGTFPTRIEVDKRVIEEQNGTMEGPFRDLHEARVGAENAAALLAELADGGDSRIAEMFNLAGYTYIMFGEDYCSGVPFGSTPATGDVVQGTPTTTAETFQLAIDRFDQAMGATDGDEDMTYLARVGKARALVDLGDYDAAATAVNGVPTGWQYLVRYSTSGGTNGIWNANINQRRWSLSNDEGINGLPFRAMDDPRLPWHYVDGRTGFDETTPLYEQDKFPTRDDDVVLASGIEARLIEAEAALANGDASTMLAKLNEARATMGLDDLTDPGSADARLDMLFEERAFWLFATAHRLGDLRRLVREYGRDTESVFPTGENHKGGVYGTDVNFPIPFDEKNNPNYDKCLDRNA